MKKKKQNGLFWNITVYVENPKESTNSKATRYKIYIQKSVAYLYPRNELLELEIKNTMLFALALKNMKYLGIILTNIYKSYTRKTTKF